MRGPTLPHTTYGDTKVTTMWVLWHSWPAGRFQLIASDPSQSGEQHAVSPTCYFETMGGRVFGWQVVEPELARLHYVFPGHVGCRDNPRGRTVPRFPRTCSVASSMR